MLSFKFVNYFAQSTDRFAQIHQSRFSENEMEKVKKSYKEVVAFTMFISVIILLLTPLFFYLYKVLTPFDNFYAILIPTALIGFYTLLQGVLFPTWTKYRNYMRLEYDGLSEEEIELLEPNQKEQQLIEQMKKSLYITVVLFIGITSASVVTMLRANISLDSWTLRIVVLALVFFWFSKWDQLTREIQRLKHGYYKKGIVAQCNQCGNKSMLLFQEFDEYKKSAQANDGIAQMNCEQCGHLVSFPTFKKAYEDYQVYLNRLK